ncbi:MAG: glycoside hydrolase family 88 protein [Prevotella sp.]|nr:glycoside hydrolase family 88 protein [Prevotella sp.]
MQRKLLLSALLLAAVCASAQREILDAARKTNDYFMAKYADPTAPTNVKRVRPSHLWTRAVYYEGLLALYRREPSERYLDYTERWAAFHRWTPRNGTNTTHADDQCCEQAYIEYLQLSTGHLTAADPRLDSVKWNLEKQMNSQRTDYWTWIDAIQMAMPVYAKMHALTGEQRYLDFAMGSYAWTRNVCGGGLFNEKDGLWWRDQDYVPPYREADGRPCYWSRGNGWVYAALVRCLAELPEGSKAYKLLRKDFIRMSRALLKCQRTDGFWNVSLASPTTYGGPEMTGTALFLYGMSWGIGRGILSSKVYRTACDRAWGALATCVHDNGFLAYNQGTGKDPSAGQPVTFNSVPDFEDYGTGCFLLGATEYYSLVARSARTDSSH